MGRPRDRFVDVVRAGSILGVVLGHWLVADVRWDGAGVVESSVLTVEPSLWPLTWLVLVIPLFFFVGGFSNARSWTSAQSRGEGYAAFVDRRTHRILAPLLVFLVVVGAAGVAVAHLGGLGVDRASGIVLQPLWFLGIYVLAVAFTPLTLRWHKRWGLGVPVALLVTAVCCDLLALGAGWTGFGYVNAVVIWMLVHQLGFFYADGRFTRPVAGTLAVLGWLLALVLTQVPSLPYSSFMVGVPGGDQGNMHPPTLAALSLGLAGVATAVLLKPLIQRVAAHDAVWRVVVVLNLSVMTLYLWHETALVVAARLVLPRGYPTPDVGSAAWWMAHTAWLLVPTMVLVGLVAVFGRAERRPPPRPAPDTALTRWTAAVGVGLLAVGVLALAGSDVTTPFARGAGLGPVSASVALGSLLTACAAWVLSSMRHGDASTGRSLLGSAVLLTAGAVGFALGAGPFPVGRGSAWTLAAAALLVVAVSSSARPRGVRPMSTARAP